MGTENVEPFHPQVLQILSEWEGNLFGVTSKGARRSPKQDLNLHSAWLVPSLNTGRKEAGEVRGASKDATSVQPRDDGGPDKGETCFESQGW